MDNVNDGQQKMVCSESVHHQVYAKAMLFTNYPQPIIEHRVVLRKTSFCKIKTSLTADVGSRTPHQSGQNVLKAVLQSETLFLPTFLPSISLSQCSYFCQTLRSLPASSSFLPFSSHGHFLQ